MMTVANLWGNTLDAFLARFHGQAAPGSNPFSELAVLFLPVVLIPLAGVAALLAAAAEFLAAAAASFRPRR